MTMSKVRNIFHAFNVQHQIAFQKGYKICPLHEHYENVCITHSIMSIIIIIHFKD